MRLRKIIFWLHLTAGVVAGSVVFVMSVTGVLLAFERQIVAIAERQVRTVQPPASSVPRLGIEALVAQARAAVPDSTPSGITLSADPTVAMVVSFGREQTVFVDPYSGVVLGEGAPRLRDFFHLVTDWHRWLGRSGESREIGRAVTGACNTAFVTLVITGFYLWWPRRWTRVALKTIMVPSLKLRGKPRDWNWHNAVGFWSAPILLIITLTGLVISYPWATNLIYTLTGSEAPPQQRRASQGRPSGAAAGTMGGQPDTRTGRQPRADGIPSGEQRGRAVEAVAAGPTSPHADLDALFSAAQRHVPHWRLMSLRLPPSGASRMTVIIEESASRHPSPRSTLTLNAATASVVTWEPYADYNLGRTIRFWVRWVHTGEAGGIIGQCIAALASAGGAVLVFTGLALAWRRFFSRIRRMVAPGSQTEIASPGITLPNGGGSTSSL